MAAEGFFFMTTTTNLQWASIFHVAIFKQINQVTHQSSFQEKKLRKILMVVLRSCMKKLYFSFKLVFIFLFQVWYWMLVQYYFLVAEFKKLSVCQKMQRGGDLNPSWAPGPSLHGSFKIFKLLVLY